jgi:UDP-glucose 4-epimerase|tara:strand:+ start:1245 stop:2237 length:993 start_codon:yes stop_codon:yes gene_type:complete
MKVLVIGGAGYIGSHVVKELIKHQCEVSVYDNLSTGSRSNIPKSVDFVLGDIQDKESLTHFMVNESFDAVIHLAALKAAGESMIQPEKYSQANLSGSINILNAMVKSNCKNIVFSSTAAVYGAPQYLPIDEKHQKDPENFYGYTKSAVEDLFYWYGKLKGICYAKLRYFNAAGYDVEGDLKGLEQSPSNLIPVVMEVALGYRSHLDIFGDDYATSDGTGVRDYVHVSDLADAHYKALSYLNNKKKQLTVNLGTGNGVSVLEIIKVARELTQREIPFQIKPRRAGDPAEVYASSALALELLGWESTYSDINTIIQTTWAAYQAHENKIKNL